MVATREKYSNNTLKDTYYDIILQRVIRDEYKSGDIITEKSLVDEFNVSKSPIREALISLCNKKHTEIRLRSDVHFRTNGFRDARLPRRIGMRIS